MRILRYALCGVLLMAWTGGADAQRTEITTELEADRASRTVRLAIPFPSLGAGITPDDLHADFFTPLTADLVFSRIVTIVPLPPGRERGYEVAREAGAQALLQLDVIRTGGTFAVEARLLDTSNGTTLLGKRYRGEPTAFRLMAHTLANDVVTYFNGRPGIFLSRIAFVSDRTGSNEVWIMDYDGSNQRQITTERALTLNPDWSPDGERLVYTSFQRGYSDLYIALRRGGGRVRIRTGVNLNTSAAFSPDGTKIAFVGAVEGNTDIYVINDDGSQLRRLTTESSIESTPAWSPNGRQIAFTSSRAGTPQIYIMDAEGTNVRRISFDGNWNDDAAFSPNGEYLAYTSLVGRSYQIRIYNLSTGESRVIAGAGSNEQPSWAPDSASLVFMSDRSGRWQIYRIGLDERDPVPLTSQGTNSSPAWSP